MATGMLALAVPREQLVGSGRLVSKQIYSQSSTACPLNRGRNYKEAIRLKENKEGLVIQLTESTERRRTLLSGQSANSLEVLSASEEHVAKTKQREVRAFCENNPREFALLPAVIQ